MKNAFDKIMAGLDDAIAFAKGDKSRGREAAVDEKAIRTPSGRSARASDRS